MSKRLKFRLNVILHHLRDTAIVKYIPKSVKFIAPKIRKRKIVVALSLALYFYFVIKILDFLRRRYKLVIGHLSLFISYFDQLSKVGISQFSLVEPLIATAMMTAFSVIYKQVRDNMVIRLENTEQDFLIQNRVSGVMNAFIRSNGQVPHEAILLAMNQMKVNMLVKCEQVDEYMKQLEVSCYHPRTGEKIAAKCLLPIHDDRFDSFEVNDLTNEQIEPIM